MLITSKLNLSELINLQNHYDKERVIMAHTISQFTEKNEMKMYRDNLINTKYKKIWKEYRELQSRYTEIVNNIGRIKYYIGMKNGK